MDSSTVENRLETGVEMKITKRSLEEDENDVENAGQPKRTKPEIPYFDFSLGGTEVQSSNAETSNPEDVKVLNDLHNLLQETTSAKSEPQETIYGENDPRKNKNVEHYGHKTYIVEINSPMADNVIGMSDIVENGVVKINTVDNDSQKMDKVDNDSPKMETVDNDSPKMDTVDNDSPKMDTVDNDSPKMDTVDNDSPKMEMVDNDSPKMETVDNDSPKMETVDNDSPKMETVDNDSPNMDTVDNDSPNMDTVDNDSPKMDTVDNDSPKMETVDNDSPKMETVDNDSPKMETVDNDSPKMETVDNDCPKMHTVDNDSPKMDTVDNDSSKKDAVVNDSLKMENVHNIDSPKMDNVHNIDSPKTDNHDNIDSPETDSVENIDSPETDSVENIDTLKTDIANNSDSPKILNVEKGTKNDTLEKVAKMTDNVEKDRDKTFPGCGIKEEIEDVIYIEMESSPANTRTRSSLNRLEHGLRETNINRVTKERAVDSDGGLGIVETCRMALVPNNNVITINGVDNEASRSSSNTDSSKLPIDCPQCRKAEVEKSTPKQVFECTNCEKEFPNRRKYKIHGESRECEGCGEWFPSACLIRMHQCEQSECWRGKFGCVQCGAVFEQQTFLARHRLKHTVTDCKKGKRKKCKFCELRHYSEKYLNLHTYHHPKMGCPVCRTRFSNLSLFTKHCGIDGTKCAQSQQTQNATEKTQPRNSRKTRQTSTIESRLSIPSISGTEPEIQVIEVVAPTKTTVTSNPTSSAILQNNVSKEKRTYACNVCDKIFLRAAKYYAHSKTRLCQGCNVGFTTACLIRLHQFENPLCCEGRFPCVKCGAVFKNQQKLDQHGKKHVMAKANAIQKRFKCSYCQFQHCSKKFMETHIRHHPKFGCPACGLQFVTLKGFREHCGGAVYHCQSTDQGLVDGTITLDDDDNDGVTLDRQENRGITTMGEDVLDLDMNVECYDEEVLPSVRETITEEHAMDVVALKTEVKDEVVELTSEVGHYNRPGPQAGAKEAERKNGRRDTYSCFDCGARASSFRDWKQHRALKHGDVQMYKCDTCPYSSTYKYEVDRHKKSRHSKKK